jgi:hypothetical protein
MMARRDMARRYTALALRRWQARHYTALALLVALLATVFGTSFAQLPEPPPEAGEGDYTLEAADSLRDQELEVAVGAASQSGGGSRRSQRVSFRGGGARGTLREGADELAGGRVSAPFAGGSLVAGLLAPRWGRGLVVGGAAEPWARLAEDRGERARYRGRSGSGVAYDAAHGGVLAGRFAKRDLAGVRLVVGPGAVGVLATRHDAQGSLALGTQDRAIELAMDSRGRWRAETGLAEDAGDTRLTLRLRGGAVAFRSLAEPARSGPSRALAASATREWRLLRAGAFGSAWTWRAGQSGARGALEVEAPLGQHESFALGVLQQRGPRREPSPRARPTGSRQGWWCEWRGGPPATKLALRHELWGTRAFAREAVRRAVVARVDRAVPYGGRIVVTHAVWRARSGESLYLPEAGADRLVLRAASGAGTRTRAELKLPMASGSIRLGLTLASGGSRDGDRPPAWSVEWSRRSRLASRAPAAPNESEHEDEIRGAHEPADIVGVVRHARARPGTGGPGTEHRPPGDR